MQAKSAWSNKPYTAIKPTTYAKSVSPRDQLLRILLAILTAMIYNKNMNVTNACKCSIAPCEIAHEIIMIYLHIVQAHIIYDRKYHDADTWQGPHIKPIQPDKYITWCTSSLKVWLVNNTSSLTETNA